MSEYVPYQHAYSLCQEFLVYLMVAVTGLAGFVAYVYRAQDAARREVLEVLRQIKRGIRERGAHDH